MTTTVIKSSTSQLHTAFLLDQRDKADLQLTLKQKEIELEHKLNTLIALNVKLQVFDDLK